MRAAATALAACVAGCSAAQSDNLQRLADLPDFAGGRVTANCNLPEAPREERERYAIRCVEMPFGDSAREKLNAYVNVLHERGWQAGGMDDRAVWVTHPTTEDCSQSLRLGFDDRPADNDVATLWIVLDRRSICSADENYRG